MQTNDYKKKLKAEVRTEIILTFARTQKYTYSIEFFIGQCTSQIFSSDTVWSCAIVFLLMAYMSSDFTIWFNFQFKKEESRMVWYGGCYTFTMSCFTKNCWTKNMKNWCKCQGIITLSQLLNCAYMRICPWVIHFAEGKSNPMLYL